LEQIDNYASDTSGLCSSCVNILNTVFKECPEGIIYRDKFLNIRTMNEAFCKLFKISSAKNYIGKKTANFLSIENIKTIDNVNFEVQNNLQPINYVINLEKENKILNIITTPVIKNNEFIGIVSIVKDITQEENIKENFVIKHYQLKSLIENIPLIIFMQDTNRNYISGTKHAKDFVNSGFDSFTNIKIETESLFNDNEYVINNNKMLVKIQEFKGSDGKNHLYKICKVPLNDFNQQVIGVITLANNIDAENQLQKQREAFVASLGHDLKNPTIAQIRGLELLLKGTFGDINEDQKEVIEMILDSCRYMNGMLANLLATYRDADGIINLNITEFSFIDLVNECISEMTYVAKEKDITITLEKNIENDIKADRVQLKRVVMNLISNGIKYAYKDSILKLKLKSNNSSINFEFENNSPYIPEEKQKNIFGQYVSYADSHKEVGIGLGLFASKKIIEAHNGKIYLKSFKDNRNIFGFRIPLKQNRNFIENKVFF